MGKYIRGSEDQKVNQPVLTESAFAQQVLKNLGGSQVYVEKAKKFVETE